VKISEDMWFQTHSGVHGNEGDLGGAFPIGRRIFSIFRSAFPVRFVPDVHDLSNGATYWHLAAIVVRQLAEIRL
jgi:hypothetical protein